MQQEPYADLVRQLNGLLVDCQQKAAEVDQNTGVYANLSKNMLAQNIYLHLLCDIFARNQQLCEGVKELIAPRPSLRDRIARQTGLPDPNAAYGPYDPVVQDRRVVG